MKYKAGGRYEGELSCSLREGPGSVGRREASASGWTLWGPDPSPPWILTRGLGGPGRECTPRSGEVRSAGLTASPSNLVTQVPTLPSPSIPCQQSAWDRPGGSPGLAEGRSGSTSAVGPLDPRLGHLLHVLWDPASQEATFRGAAGRAPGSPERAEQSQPPTACRRGRSSDPSKASREGSGRPPSRVSRP